MTARDILVRVRVEINNLRRDTAQASALFRSTGDAATAMCTAASTAARSMIGPMTQAQAAAQDTRQALYDAGKAAQESATGFGLSYNAAGRLTDQFGNVVTEAHAAEVGLATASEATQEYAAQTVAAAAAAAEAAAAATAESQSGIDALLETAAANEEAWSKVGAGMLVVGGTIAAGVGVSIAKFASFDKAMSSVDAATHETAGNMELLREKAIQVGADTAFSAEEAAGGIEELAKAGLSTKDILNGGLAGAMDLAAAGALDVSDAAEFAASSMVQFGLSGEDIPHIADLLAAGAGKAQGSVADMGLALSYAGVPAKGLGVSIEETTGMIALFASNGIVGEKAGTALRSMFVSMQNPSKKAASVMEDLGIKVFDAKGNFIGMEGAAGILSDKLGGLTVEARGSALATIFGSEALGAATAMYEGGAEKVQEWTDAVNDSGYAADTAARMQDNLAGDLEALGGAFDTLMIKSGTGPAEMLRGLVQGAEGVVDALGQIPTPVLTTITITAALVGGLALVGGAFITIVPKIAATRASLVAFNASTSISATRLRTLGKAGGIAAAGVAVAGVAFEVFGTKSKDLDMDQMTSDLIHLGKEGVSVREAFSPGMFDAANDAMLQGEKIDSLGDALKKVTDVSTNDKAWSGVFGVINGARALIGVGAKGNQFTETVKAIQGMSDGLATMVQNGDVEEAGIAFAKIATEGEKSGVSVDKLSDSFATYETALRKQADTLKVALTDEEYYQWMLGNVPPLIDAAKNSAEGQTAAAEAQAAANEETAQRLADVGLAADGTVISLGKLLEAMFATGLAQMSQNEAAIRWEESLIGVNDSLVKYGQNLDITTEGGKANSRALDGMAQAGISNMEAMANNGASQEALQAKLTDTYNATKAAAEQFGMGAEEADAYARGVLGIPEGKDVNIAIKDFAAKMAELNGVKGAVDGIPGQKNINIHTSYTYSEQTPYPARVPANSIEGNSGIGAWMDGTFAQGGLVGFARGGVIPGKPPTDLSRDNLLGMVGGKAIGVQSGEYIMPTAETRANLPVLESMRNGSYQAPSKSLAGGYSAAMSHSVNGGGGGGGVTVEINIGDLLAADLPGIKREVIDAIDKKYRNAGVIA